MWFNKSLEQQLLSNLTFLSFSLLIPPLLILIFLFKWSFTNSTTTKILPPSPPRLPIIGNFHQLTSFPHRAIWSLSQRYGPLMLLHFGRVPVLIVSSPEAACEVMKTNDLAFATRRELWLYKQLFYNNSDVVASPYGEHWRQLKTLFTVRLVNKKRVQSFRYVRVEETEVMMRKIKESCRSNSNVDFRDLFVTLANDVGCMAAFGSKYTSGEDGKKLKHLLDEFSALVGAFCFRDYIPMFGWLDRVNGTVGRVKRVVKGLDDFFERLIEERMARGINLDEEKQDFLAIMLKIQQGDGSGISLTRDNIKALLLDIYVAGTDTTSTFLEWVMAELLRNPNSMKKLQNEVRQVLNGKLDISDDDLKKMKFLKAVIKETLRVHPASGFIPRATTQDIKLMGYDIGADTMIIINSWGIANDPKLWDEPDEFRPERFMDSSVDYEGHDFEYTPFGAGRRQCPGISFAIAIIEYVLANLMYKFNWELPMGVKVEDMDMTERPGSAILVKNIGLEAIATPYYY